jgi:hypothetical protein
MKYNTYCKQQNVWSTILTANSRKYEVQCLLQLATTSAKVQINHQLDSTIFPVFYLKFIYSSTCFGRPHAHHQELNNCSSSLWFYLRSVVKAVLLFVVGPDYQKHCYHHAPNVKPEDATAVVELLMTGVKTPETCWAVNKLQVKYWRNCCI